MVFSAPIRLLHVRFYGISNFKLFPYMMLASKSIYLSSPGEFNATFLNFRKSYENVPFWPKITWIIFIKATDRILVSKSIYSSRGIQWCIYKNPKITHSISHTNMCQWHLYDCVIVWFSKKFVSEDSKNRRKKNSLE